MALDFSSQSRRAPFTDRGLDLYETPDVAVKALLRVERLPYVIWEPAAGRGAIVRVLRDYGHAVIASDIHDYGELDFVGNFLSETKSPAGVEAIVSNLHYQTHGFEENCDLEALCRRHHQVRHGRLF